MEKLYSVLAICEIIASIFAAVILIWAFVDDRKKQELKSIQLVTGIAAVIVSILAVSEVVVFVRWCIIL